LILCIYSAQFGRLRRVFADDSKLTVQDWAAVGTGVGKGEAQIFVPPRDKQPYTLDELQAIVTQQTGLDPEKLGDYFATVLNGVVVDYGHCDPACGDFPSDPKATMHQAVGVGVGWTFDGKTFSPVYTAEEQANMQRKGALAAPSVMATTAPA
jgi:hypothetical protein